MPILNSYKIDPELESAGVEVEYGDPSDPFKLRVARLYNPAMREEMRKLLEPHVQEDREGKLDPDLRVELFNRAVSRTVFLSLANATEPDGSPIPDTDELRFRILTEPGYEGMRDFVLQVATEQARFSEQAREDAAGNSGGSSSGGSGSATARSDSDTSPSAVG